ncbi:craniofacial development protein 2-like [Harmonia axyridis]|uniref:craniofacial development protein 2-like n=1 Tax=Harmonia axyridis TaxID=115357 RepID=UPI001E278370|nr:craniofacial development protein 2-like [Harmonia axyridis]
MYEAGKIHNTIKEMRRLSISILGISEMRWPNSGQSVVDDHTIYYIGDDGTRNRNGVAVILSKGAAPAFTNTVLLSDRVMMVQMKTDKVDLIIVQVYALTYDHDEEEMENFYHQIEELLKLTKSNQMTVIMGDINAKIGRGKEDPNFGEFGLVIRNDRGDRFKRFCNENNLIIANTFFDLPERRLYTWTSPAHTQDKIVRNQIDYICKNMRFRNSMTSVKTYPGADVPSDHNLLVGKMKVRLKKVNIRPEKTKIDHDKVNNALFRETIQNELNEKMRHVR